MSERLNCGLGGTVLALTGFLVLIRMHDSFALTLPSLLKELGHLGRKRHEIILHMKTIDVGYQGHIESLGRTITNVDS